MNSMLKKTSSLIIPVLATSLIVHPILATAATDLTDVPLAVQADIRPNILFTLDNSGSMEWGTITGSDATAEFNSSKSQRAYYSPSFNRLYYNPAITYLPAAKYDATATGYTSSMAASSITGARIDPYPTTSGNTDSIDLTQTCWGTSTVPTLPRYNASSFATNSNCATSSSKTNTVQYARYAFYYVWKSSDTENGSSTQDKDSNYQRVEILSTTTFPARASSRTDCGTATTCTYDQEIQNFANWFTYYRTRILTAKSSLGLAFSGLDDKSRVGFSTINDNSSDDNTTAANFVPMGNFDQTQKNTWYSKVYKINPNGGTPLRTALDRAGQYFTTGTMKGGTSTKRETTVPLSCTPNYTILSTDGYWNGDAPSAGDKDKTVPTLPANVYVNPDTKADVNDPIAGVPLKAGSNFPAPFYDGNGAKDTLADVAMKYWITDMTGSSAGKVIPNNSDPATWQHMTTYTIGLGATGTLTTVPTGSGTWPTPAAEKATAIDDLWHAALNGHGQYFNANDPAKLKVALASILNSITARSGATASVAVSNPNVKSGDNSAFASSYNSGGWFGDLQAFSINLDTGGLSDTALWSAQSLLDAKTFGSRYIASFSGTAGVAFTTTGLQSKLSRLNSPTTPPGPSDNANVIAYLRGDRSKEGDSTNSSTKPYRTRTHVLGDIVDAEPIYVPASRSAYTDNGYADFKASNAVANRTKVVYQGANDGMLHAFNATTGQEMWAYVPGSLVDTNLSASNTSTSSLVGLTQQTLFQHRFFVDSTPVATDVDLNNTQGNQTTPPTPRWATILVGGLGKGGRGYYALNITSPDATSDEAVASKVMWEFPNDNTALADRKNIGYSYGTPLNVKTKAAGWVTIVTSGYNNGTDTGGDGLGHLYVLNAATGALIKDLSTGVGTSANPSGLAKVSPFLTSAGVDDTADYVYGGDLLGNVWRFDLSGDTTTSWNVKRLATLVDADNNAQPVTGNPELGVVNSKRVVYVGTGQYLGLSDVPGSTTANASSSQRQSFYGLVDDQSSTPTITSLRSQLVQQTATLAGGTSTAINVTSNPADLASKKGWVLDFVNNPAGERSYTSPVLFQGILAFTTNAPSSDPCSPGGSSNLYFLNYANGGAIPNLSSRVIGNVMASRVQPIGLPNGTIKILVRTSDGKTKLFDVAIPSSTNPTRVMWREVIAN